MSDIDEMDVDEVQTSEKVGFSSKELEKGKKRIAADLPVTIGDNLPWCISHLEFIGEPRASCNGPADFGRGFW